MTDGRIHLPWQRELVRPCPECGALVVWPHNDVLLDWPALPFSEILGQKWTIQRYLNVPPRGSTRLLALPYKGPSIDGQGHRLHDHQPPTSAVRDARLSEYAPVIREEQER